MGDTISHGSRANDSNFVDHEKELSITPGSGIQK